MTDSTPPSRRTGNLSATGALSFARAVAGNQLTLWAAFVLVHLWLGLLNLYAPGYPLGDVITIYKFWMDQAFVANFWVGIDSVWVYPIVAIVPMVIAFVFGSTYYASTWLTMVLLLNAVAFATLTGWGRTRRNTTIGWWWVGFMLLLGPITLGRIDSVTVPLALTGVLLVATRPQFAAVILTVAAWIKVWPAALIVAVVIATKDRKIVFGTALAVSLGIIALAVSFGSGLNVFSFFTTQSSRGLEVESPVAVIWMWMSAAGVEGAFPYYDQGILAFQVVGPGSDVASAIMTPIMGVVGAGILLLGIVATRRGAPAAHVLPTLVLALVVTTMVFNKVGSPQFYSWLAVPVVYGLVTHASGLGRSFRTPATIVLVLAALTQVVYPYLFTSLLTLDPVMLIVITGRHLLLIALLGWAVTSLVTIARNGASGDDRVEPTWLPSVWPLQDSLKLQDSRRDTVDTSLHSKD